MNYIQMIGNQVLQMWNGYVQTIESYQINDDMTYLFALNSLGSILNTMYNYEMMAMQSGYDTTTNYSFVHSYLGDLRSGNVDLRTLSRIEWDMFNHLVELGNKYGYNFLVRQPLLAHKMGGM